jgi:2-hydroxychromene-2-carboxylate isomerase
VYRRQFAGGADITDLDVLAAAAGEAGLDPAQLRPAIEAQQIKDALRRSTEAAWEHGVRGVPSIRVGERVFFGDDRLEEAASELAPD